ncbi:hypothetical protein [Bacteroides sp.]|uniref:hypothetical protein n=1 Tax=Bacteroides sp. TaxID=29523 RepID=UPI00262E78EC|nr:hypothetical protein [Bacteroides sp.]MDD3039540.1 hypothetical protein [Bacteroides sp.]
MCREWCNQAARENTPVQLLEVRKRFLNEWEFFDWDDEVEFKSSSWHLELSDVRCYFDAV